MKNTTGASFKYLRHDLCTGSVQKRIVISLNYILKTFLIKNNALSII